MRLDEINKFNSIVYNILEKTVDRGVDVNIDLSLDNSLHAIVARRNLPLGTKFGKIDAVNYWSTENIVNISYTVGDVGTDEYQRFDWRYRPLSSAVFDDEFTIRKIDGVPTFMKRQQFTHEHQPGSL